MSDDNYSSFLDQANQDRGNSKASSKSKSTKMSTKSVDTDVPASLQKMEVDYASEADEPFEPVSLTWDGNNMPSESACKLSWLSSDMERHQIDTYQMNLAAWWAMRVKSQLWKPRTLIRSANMANL